MKLIRCHNVNVLNNKFMDGHLKYCVVMVDVDNVEFSKNSFKARKYVLNKISGVTFKKNIIYGGDIYPTDIKNMANSVFNDRIRGNKVIRKYESK